MIENGESVSARTVVLRCIGPAALLLAGLLFLFLPVAGASCGKDDGPVQLCVSGGQLVTGQPSVDPYGILTLDYDELESGIVNTIGLPNSLGTLALFLLLILLSGGLSSLIPNPRARAAGALASALLGAGLLIFIEVQTVDAMTDGVSLIPSMFSSDLATASGEAGELVDTDFGFWSPLALLIAVAIVNGVLASPGTKESGGLDRLTKNWDAVD